MKYEITGKYWKLDHTVATFIDAKSPYVAYTMALKIFKDIFKDGSYYPDSHELKIDVIQVDGVAINGKADTTGF